MLANASIQAATTLQRLAACATHDGFLATTDLGASTCPHGWGPSFRGDDTCRLVGRVSARSRASSRVL